MGRLALKQKVASPQSPDRRARRGQAPVPPRSSVPLPKGSFWDWEGSLNGSRASLGLWPGLQARFGRSLGADFSQVRLFPNHPEVTEPLQAKAVTQGQRIYFHPGQFRPGTVEGDRLLAHELAHTLQTRDQPEQSPRQGISLSQSSEALERNADALAQGASVSIRPAPAGLLLRSPFEGETPTAHARRERLIQAIDHAMQNILSLLRTGSLVANAEVVTVENGVQGVSIYPGSPGAIFVSYHDRDARLRRIVRSLMVLARQYRTAPIPPEFAPPIPSPASESTPASSRVYSSEIQRRSGSIVYGGRTAEWADLQGAYGRYQIAQGQEGQAFDADWIYLNPDLQRVPGAARGAPRIGNGIPTGAYRVVPDIEQDPLRYWPLTGFDPIPPGSVIVEFWHDDFGYYYLHRGRRIDVPSPWAP
ncbi:eCIS core domain-containing protein [Lyngbya confervoides]|uniref:DUF4157 domain-containing protein n=1 Tax=Lyngbya confervoides BDU141951 TaxID=1574623 RepID=A0ABD4SZA3_9CYAN|nr:DUF4157 domain-containing protein [Lyngbya confervoides]MCM1981583.1 DUF4157 domain-containing protein [Lyngbya confervoides BDU141951]